MDFPYYVNGVGCETLDDAIECAGGDTTEQLMAEAYDCSVAEAHRILADDMRKRIESLNKPRPNLDDEIPF